MHSAFRSFTNALFAVLTFSVLGILFPSIHAGNTLSPGIQNGECSEEGIQSADWMNGWEFLLFAEGPSYVYGDTEFLKHIDQLLLMANYPQVQFDVMLPCCVVANIILSPKAAVEHQGSTTHDF